MHALAHPPQQRAIDKAVEVKYGSRLSSASPAYQTVAKARYAPCCNVCPCSLPVQKMKKKGSDVTQGEEAKLVVTGVNITFIDVKNAAKFVPLYSRDVHFVSVFSKTPISELLALVIKTETKFYCHIFTTKPGGGDELKATVMESVRRFMHACLSNTRYQHACSASMASGRWKTQCWPAQ